MSVKLVLFDLDGTLLPMDQDVFTKAYFGALSGALAKRGYEPSALIKAVWAGTAAMVKNDGKRPNEKAFWEVFCSVFGERAIEDEPYLDAFYRSESGFETAHSAVGFNPRAAEAVSLVKRLGLRCALATNPLFPSVATEKRISWAGLSTADFEIYTTYENSHFCKPNLAYYEEILEKLNVKAEECLMVGNDACEDMIASELGMKVFLLTDCLINKTGVDISVYPRGGFDELCAYLKEIRG